VQNGMVVRVKINVHRSRADVAIEQVRAVYHDRIGATDGVDSQDGAEGDRYRQQFGHINRHRVQLAAQMCGRSVPCRRSRPASG
jgi:hypothetical protein